MGDAIKRNPLDAPKTALLIDSQFPQEHTIALDVFAVNK
jgi:hypothetical protein